MKPSENEAWVIEELELFLDFPQKKRVNPDGWRKNIEQNKRTKGMESVTSKGVVKPAEIIETEDENMPTCSCRDML